MSTLAFVQGNATTATQQGDRITFTMKFNVTATSGVESNTLTFLVPKDLPLRQKVISLSYSQAPTQEFENSGNRYARFVMNNPSGSTAITATATVELYHFDLNMAKALGSPLLETAAGLQPWLASEKYLEKDSPEIQNVAKTITGADDITVLRNIMAFVTKTLRPSAFSSADRGALWALENKNGDCTEFAELFVTLCRAKNIPARFCEGYLGSAVPAGQPAAHDWAEAYTSKYGWVRFDPLHVRDRMATFDALKADYLQLSDIRHDAGLTNSHYYRWDWEGGGNVKVDGQFTVTHRQPIR
jgi:transglutaminase-like putative cysteine protease